MNVQPLILGRHLPPQRIHRLGNDLANRKGLKLERSSGFDALQVEQVLDQRRDVGDPLADLYHKDPLLVVEGPGHLDQVHKTSDGRQRRAQVVGHGRNKLVFQVLQFPKFLDRLF